MTDIDEKHYHDACHQLFTEIEKFLETTDADYDNNGNVMEIISADEEKIIINKQAPMREIWLAAKSGGKHFRLDAEGNWRDTRDNSTLMSQLKTLLTA